MLYDPLGPSLPSDCSILKLFHFGIAFAEAIFIEYYEFILFPACHLHSRYRENNPFSCKLANFMKRQYEILIFSVHRKFVGLVCDGRIVHINSAA